MKSDRLRNSFFNSVSNILILLSNTILSFILRTVFIKILGEQCLGLDGLFTNILSLLSLTELGISSAISFSLYKPLAENNRDKISKLMSFYKKLFRLIALFVLIVGLILLPFLKYMVKGYTIDYNIYYIYILYVFNTMLSYLITYKTILIEADQKNYLLTPIKVIFNILVYGLQILFLIITKDLMVYLIIQLVVRQIERIITNIYIGKKYSYIDFNYNKKIDKDDQEKIKENVKGIIFHRVGNYAVNGTDNILISSIVNISSAGFYSNYLSIISIIKSFIGGMIVSATSSFGNLNVTDTNETKFNIFNIMDFVCFFITGLSAIGIYFLINTFVKLWIGDTYILNELCVIIITINFYLICMLFPIDTVKDSTGTYYVDRFVPIIQAAINLILSFILGSIMGLAGIILATTISYITTVSWSKAYVIYKYVFNKSIFLYLKKQFKNLLILAISFILTKLIFDHIDISNLWILFFVKGIILSLLFLIIFYIFYHNTVEFKYFKGLVFNRKK